ncbi:hypothetical protein ACQ4PT_047619 [Festuca glaucescens]
MWPVRRPDGDPPPVYGSDSEKFSVKLNHGGYFLGTGENRAYVGGSVVWYDQCEKAGWSADSVHSLVENLGYESEGRIKIYFCLPGWSINTKGLLEIRGDFQSDKMIAAVNCGHQFLRLYLDHDDSITGDIWDDTVEFHVADLPAIISPNKQGRHVDVPIQMVCPDAQPEVKKTKRELAMEEANEVDNISVNSEDSDYEPEIIDSDYDVSDEDSDLKEDVIDEEEGYKGKHVHMADNSDDDLDLPDSDEESIRYNFKTFRVEDMHKPAFQSGQVFGSVELLRKAIREYSCQNRVDIKFPINDRKRLCAKCEPGCPWYLWASTDSRTKSFQIKRFDGEHTCSKKWKVRAFTSVFLAEKHEDITPEDMVSPWYSIDSFKRAYSNIIRPCRDRREWKKTYGINVEPPAYDKKVGRPSKNRRTAPHELEHHMGGKKMSRHGVIIHCSYCGGPGHNIGGCKDKKNGMPPKQYVSKKKKEVVRLLPDSSDEDEPVITQDHNMEWQSGLNNEDHVSIGTTMLDEMLQQRPVRVEPQFEPLPESSFIVAAWEKASQASCSSAQPRQGDLAKEVEAIKQAKNNAAAEKKESAVQARIRKEEEALALKAQIAKLKAEESQQKKMLAAQKKKRKNKLQRKKRLQGRRKQRELLLLRRKLCKQKQRREQLKRTGL